MGRNFSVIHLSDLHFGRIHPEILTHLEEFMRLRNHEIKLAIVTGDITQRAKKNEFLAAKEFISAVSSPIFIVPGNHDVPLYNLFLRFFSPYKKFLRYMGPFAQNYYEDENVAVYGMWTTNNFRVQSGKIRKDEIHELKNKFNSAPSHKIKFIACHHPVVDDRNLDQILSVNPHFILWGHEHQSGVRHAGKTLMLASGTSASTRIRAEANSFNYITIMDNEVTIEVYRHSKMLEAFEVIDRQTFLIS